MRRLFLISGSAAITLIAGLSMAHAAVSSLDRAGVALKPGDNWITTIAYAQGASQLNLRPASLLDPDDDLLHSHALGLSVAKRGLFGGNDSLDIGIARKLQSYTANIDLTDDGGFDAGGLKGNSLVVPQTGFEVGYVTTFLDGALALQANSGYQTNMSEQNGQNALTVLSRAKFNF